jgi:hypothetical protein
LGKHFLEFLVIDRGLCFMPASRAPAATPDHVPAPLSAAQAAVQLDSDKKRHAALTERRRMVAVNLEERTKAREAARARARAQFGTDDPVELQRILAATLEENSRKVTEFRIGLDSVQSELARIDQSTAA